MTTTEQWITKEEAGVRLGTPERPLSARRILELAKEGRLQSKQDRDVTTGHMTVRIHAGSVERFIFERDTPRPRADNGPMSPGQVSPNLADRADRENRANRAPISRDMYHVLIKLLAGELALPADIATAGSAGLPARLWLTLKEASDYSGLPSDVITNQIGQGLIKALWVGKGRRGGPWRIRRQDLEAFAG